MKNWKLGSPMWKFVVPMLLGFSSLALGQDEKWAADTGDEKPLEVHGNPNVLTRDIGSSSLAQGPTAHSCLVEMERFDARPPVNLAFDPILSLVTQHVADQRSAP